MTVCHSGCDIHVDAAKWVSSQHLYMSLWLSGSSCLQTHSPTAFSVVDDRRVNGSGEGKPSTRVKPMCWFACQIYRSCQPVAAAGCRWNDQVWPVLTTKKSLCVCVCVCGCVCACVFHLSWAELWIPLKPGRETFFVVSNEGHLITSQMRLLSL